MIPAAREPKYEEKAIRVLNACRRCVPVRLNPRHTVCTDACKLWKAPGKLAFVCCQSGNVHFCGPDCNIPSRLSMDNDTFICPLTHVVLDTPVYTTTPSFTPEGRPITHWGTFSKRKRLANKAPITRTPKTCTNIVAERIVIRCFNAGVELARLRTTKKIKSVLASAKRQRPQSFLACARLVRQNIVISLPPCTLLARILGTSISNFLARHPKLKLGSTEIAVGTMLTLMSSGLAINGVTLVEKVSSLQARMPLPTEMSTVKKINCRGVSMGVRNFKDYVLSDNGIPVYNKCFRFSDSERQDIFRAIFNFKP